MLPKYSNRTFPQYKSSISLLNEQIKRKKWVVYFISRCWKSFFTYLSVRNFPENPESIQKHEQTPQTEQKTHQPWDNSLCKHHANGPQSQILLLLFFLTEYLHYSWITCSWHSSWLLSANPLLRFLTNSCTRSTNELKNTYAEWRQTVTFILSVRDQS